MELAEAARRLHFSSLVFDAHSDVVLDIVLKRLQGKHKVLENIHLPRLREGGVSAAIVPVAWDEPMTNAYTLEALLRTMVLLMEELEESSGSFIIATTADDIRMAHSEGKIALVISIEGAAALGYDLTVLKILKKLGLSCIGLTWNLRNQFADGVGEKSRAGLSELGFELIKQANKNRILIDISHASDKTFWDVIETTTAPLIASHSNTRTIHEHPRNLDDEQLQALAEKGGVVGITFYPEFVSERKPTIEHVIEHIDHVANIIGVDHLALGPDYIDYIAEYVVEMLRRLPSIYKADNVVFPEGLEDVTKLPHITERLLERGYSQSDIRKILGENLLRVFEQSVG